MAIQHTTIGKVASENKRETVNLNLVQKFNAFADQQQPNAMIWWLASLMIIGIFVPLTFLLVYSFSGPTLPFLALSLISFFLNIVANMTGLGIRASISTFLFSLFLHTAMIATVLIAYL